MNATAYIYLEDGIFESINISGVDQRMFYRIVQDLFCRIDCSKNGFVSPNFWHRLKIGMNINFPTRAYQYHQKNKRQIFHTIVLKKNPFNAFSDLCTQSLK